MSVNPKWLVGKVVERVELNRFDDGRGGAATDPKLYFTDGSSLAFIAQELEHGDGYGVGLIYLPAKRGRPRKPAKDTPPRIESLSPAMEAALYRQIAPTIRERLVGREHIDTPLHALPADLLQHVRDYITGRAGAGHR